MVTDFSSKKVSNKKGNLDALSKRVLGKLSHYGFKKCLIDKCEKYECQYLEVSESYTTKTCCNCGNVNFDLTTENIYECANCNLSIDRDINGAICIFIKNHSLVLK